MHARYTGLTMRSMGSGSRCTRWMQRMLMLKPQSGTSRSSGVNVPSCRRWFSQTTEKGNGNGDRIDPNMNAKESVSRSSSSTASTSSMRTIPKDGLTFAHFLSQQNNAEHSNRQTESMPYFEPLHSIVGTEIIEETEEIYDIDPARQAIDISAYRQTYYIETYGCQMNASDTEIIEAILQKDGLKRTDRCEDASLIMLNTCAIRENAEDKIWNRLSELKRLKEVRHKSHAQVPLVAVLGCMAERLKEKLLEVDKKVDIVVGPDAYRDLPRLIRVADDGTAIANTQLSLEETYAGISPVRSSSNGVSAYVSIQRGCDNMCSYCIVPFTRGRERSRETDLIVEEIQDLSNRGYKEVVLLGQNVNSYNYYVERRLSETKDAPSRGFVNIARKPEIGVGFADLVDRVARINPEMRIRFISPHPKDFPDELLRVIRDHPNVCNSIHIPAQSGSTTVLNRMRRGYTRENYLDLVQHFRNTIPTVSISSDFIAGFCGETEAEHEETLALMETVKYDNAFMFAYSQREKTHAHRRLPDDVPENIKLRRLSEIIDTFQRNAAFQNKALVGTIQLVLVDGYSRRTKQDLSGRTDGNRRVNFPEMPLHLYGNPDISISKQPQNGDYVAILITSSTSSSLYGRPLGITTLREFFKLHPDCANAYPTAEAASVFSAVLHLNSDVESKMSFAKL